jgi:chromosome segregation ATPase
VTQVSYEKAALSKEVDVKESELKAWKSKFEASEKAKANVDNEIIKLTHIIKMSCKQIDDQKMTMNDIIEQRDMLGTQLIRRNDELALLYEKIKILQSKLARGEVQYQERLEDIRLLKFKIGDHKSELRIIKSQAA